MISLVAISLVVQVAEGEQDLDKLKVSELTAMVQDLEIEQADIDSCFDADQPRDQLMQLILKSRATTASYSDANAAIKSNVNAPCSAGEVATGKDRCEKAAHVGRISGTVFTYSENVPMLLKEFGPELKALLPWLKDYILEREAEWIKLPTRSDEHGRRDDNNPTLSARSTKYSLLGSGRTALERKNLRLLTEFVADALVDLQNNWQDLSHPANVANLKGFQAWGQYVKSYPWTKLPGLWVESWANVHRYIPEDWANYSHIDPHAHSLPFSGYITINAEPSVTVMRSPLTGKLFTVEGQNGRLQLFPGGIRHSTLPWEDQAEPRISMAVNIDVVQPGSHVQCQIPLTMKYCQSQTKKQIEVSKTSWISLVDEYADLAAEQAEEGKIALNVAGHDVTAEYSKGGRLAHLDLATEYI